MQAELNKMLRLNCNIAENVAIALGMVFLAGLGASYDFFSVVRTGG